MQSALIECIYLYYTWLPVTCHLDHHSGSAEFNFLSVSQQIYKSQDIFFPDLQKVKSLSQLIKYEVKSKPCPARCLPWFTSPGRRPPPPRRSYFISFFSSASRGHPDSSRAAREEESDSSSDWSRRSRGGILLDMALT